jgi:hypothetical protein
MQRAEMGPVSDPSARCFLCRLTLHAQPIMRGSLELLRRRERPGDPGLLASVAVLGKVDVLLCRE